MYFQGIPVSAKSALVHNKVQGLSWFGGRERGFVPSVSHGPLQELGDGAAARNTARAPMPKDSPEEDAA